jgi:hypothetical protein
MSRSTVVPVPPAPALDPLERLARSRAAMREALQAGDARPAGAGAPAQAAAPRGLNGLIEHPLVVVLAAAARQGWDRHPWHIGLQLASEMLSGVLKPMVQRHPVKMVLAAALLGGVSTGVLVGGRAWRWILKPAVVAGLLSQGLKLAAAAQAASRPDAARH